MKPKALQTILGHSNIGITMNLYVHTTEEQKYKEIDLVADALKVIQLYFFALKLVRNWYVDILWNELKMKLDVISIILTPRQL